MAKIPTGLEKLLTKLDTEIDNCIKNKQDKICVDKIWRFYTAMYSSVREDNNIFSEDKLPESLADIAEETIKAGMLESSKEALHWLKEIYSETGDTDYDSETGETNISKCKKHYERIVKKYEAKFNEKYNGT